MILRILSLSALALALVTTSAFAAKGTKGNKANAQSARLLARFDTNSNGVIDADELPRLQAMYAALYALDTNHDGQISESEAAAAKIPVRKGGGRAGKKGKNAAPATTPTTPSSSSSSSSPSTTTTPAKPQ